MNVFLTVGVKIIQPRTQISILMSIGKIPAVLKRTTKKEQFKKLIITNVSKV